MWKDQRQNPPPEFEEIKIKVLVKERDREFETTRSAVFMQGHFYSVDLTHCIEEKKQDENFGISFKIVGWQSIITSD